MNRTWGEGSRMRSLKIQNKNNFKTEFSYNFHKIQTLIMKNKVNKNN